MSEPIPALDKSTSIEELLYMLGNREFLIYKHERERDKLYHKLSELEEEVRVIRLDNDDLLLEAASFKSKKNGKLSNKSKRK